MPEAAPSTAAPAATTDGRGTDTAAAASAPAATTTTTSASSTSTTSTGDKPWYDGQKLSDEEIGFIQTRKYDGVPAILKNVQDFEKMKGAPLDQLVVLPKDLNDAKAMEAVFNRLGRPENPQGYGDFKAPEGIKIPEGVSVDADRLKWADGVAHKLGFNKAQRNALVAETMAYESGLISAAEQEMHQQQTVQLEQLKKDWGNAFEERSELGRRAARAFLPGSKAEKDSLLNALEGSLGTAAMLKLFSNIGEKLGEDKIHDGDSGDRPFGYTPEQAKADIKALTDELQDPKNRVRLGSYNQGKGDDYKKMQRLIAIAHGKKPAA